MADPQPDDDFDKMMEEMGRLQEQIDSLATVGNWTA